MGTARRVYIYVMAFAGLVAALAGASGLLSVIVTTLTLHTSTLLGSTDTRSRVSLYLAALIVGLLIWLIHWLLAQRAAVRDPAEYASAQRRLYLAAVFATTAIIALVSFRQLLGYLLTLPGGPADTTAELSAVNDGTKFLVYAVVWIASTRGGARPGNHGVVPDSDDIRDIALFALTGVALILFLIGVGEALREILRDVLGPISGSAQDLLAGPGGTPWVIWGNIAASLIAGGGAWTAVWQHDLARAGLRRVRIWFLYLVLIISAPTALTSSVFLLYELLRRLLGYQQADNTWGFLRDWLPLLVTSGVVWIYHWGVLRRQAGYAPTEASVAGRGIPWPRRPALALLTLLGLAASTPALISLLWLGLDFLFHSGASLSGPGWWRDRLSFGVAATVVGVVTWLGGWSVLEGAVASNPDGERAATARRLLLGAIVLLGALSATGFAIALLWLGIRAALGDSLSPGSVSLALKELSTALITAALAIYHAQIIRRDGAAPRGAPLRPLRILALLTPDADAALASLREQYGLHVDVVGRLDEDDQGPVVDLAALQSKISALVGTAGSDRALLILSPKGGNLYPYQA